MIGTLRRSFASLPAQSRIGALLAAALLVIALVGPLLAAHPPTEPHYADKLLPPSPEYWLGTDQFGRDLLSRVLHGLRLSVLSALAVLAGSVLISLAVGIIAAVRGGWVDRVLTRVIDVILAVPSLVLALAVVGLLGPGLVNLLIALLISSWATDARVTRALSLDSLSRGHIQAARALGVSRPALAVRHVLPDIIGRVMVVSTLRLGGMVVSLAGLSFLGLGVQVPTAELGAMLGEARRFITAAPWLLIWPTVAILLLTLAFNLIAEGLDGKARRLVHGV